MKNKGNESSYSHVLKYTWIFGGVQGLGILIGIVRNKLVAVLLGPEGVGLISLFISTINFVSNATNLGLSFSAVRHVSELFESGDERHINRFIKVVRTWSLLTALVGMFICIVISPLLNKWTFSWGNHTLHFILLSPIVALAAITGGETAILKGARRLGSLAKISIYTVFAALIISVPIYYYFGEQGIVPSLVLVSLATMLVTICFSYHLYPLTNKRERGLVCEGYGMLKLGISFVLAGILGSGAELIIRSFLNNVSSLDTVGLYNAGYVMTVTYASMVFSAMETDYFPRLSSINHDAEATNLTVNRQIEVSLLLISPMLVIFMIFLPILLPLLFSGKFNPVIGMAQVAIFSMYIKAMTLPVSYITLAKADSVAYLTLEAIYDIVLVLLMIFCFRTWGLYGTGVALSIAGLIDLLVIYIYARIRYDYRISKSVMMIALSQLPLGFVAFGITFIQSPLLYWLSGITVITSSMVISIYILRGKTSLWAALVKKVKSKFGHV